MPVIPLSPPPRFIEPLARHLLPVCPSLPHLRGRGACPGPFPGHQPPSGPSGPQPRPNRRRRRCFLARTGLLLALCVGCWPVAGSAAPFRPAGPSTAWLSSSAFRDLWNYLLGRGSGNPAMDHNIDGRIDVADLIALYGRRPLPPDPADVAPEPDRTGEERFADQVDFLYTGDRRVQQDADPESFEAIRLAVVRGRALDEHGEPLADVRVFAPEYPQYGHTWTRADGRFDLAVNGGAGVLIRFEKPERLPVQRRIVVPWSDYVQAPDVALTPLDPMATQVQLGTAEAQVAQGSVTNDDMGSRQGTLIFPPATRAVARRRGSLQIASVPAMTVRITEFTVGEFGPQRMPDALPANTGYTYAMDLLAEDDAGVPLEAVTFSSPVAYYVDNYLEFPTGSVVPVGYYDYDQGAWAPAPNGRVIAVLSIAQNRAVLDVAGEGTPATPAELTALGVTDAEREQLGRLYAPGQTLWRAPIPHFSPWDLNWPIGPPKDAEYPDLKEFNPQDPNRPCDPPRPVVEFQTQTLGEEIPLVGVPWSLHYRTNRMPGYRADYAVTIPLGGDQLPQSLKQIILSVHVAGRSFEQSFAPVVGQHYTYLWDGLDAYGRRLVGRQTTSVNVTYLYDSVYQVPAVAGVSFNLPGEGSFDRIIASFDSYRLSRSWLTRLGGLSAIDTGMGGWSFDVHHRYSPSGQMLYRGDGVTLDAARRQDIIRTMAGGGPFSPIIDYEGKPALDLFLVPMAMASTARGELLVAHLDRILLVDAMGIVHNFAGGGDLDLSDGLPVTDVALPAIMGMAVGPDGSVYFSDTGGGRIFRILPNGVARHLAGNGEMYDLLPGANRGEGLPAIEAPLMMPTDIAVGLDGSLYFSDGMGHFVRRVGADGRIQTIAGTVDYLADSLLDDIPASQATVVPIGGLAVRPDGAILVADRGSERIRIITPDGQITTLAGQMHRGGYGGDGGLATEAYLSDPGALALTRDGSVVFCDRDNQRIRKISPYGIISTIAGAGEDGSTSEGIAALSALLPDPFMVTAFPGGGICYADAETFTIRRIGSPIASFHTDDILVVADTGEELYRFDMNGRHLETRNGLTGGLLRQFEYDSEQRLIAIIDGDGQRLSIERDSAGQALALVAPCGRRSALDYDANGYLASVTDPMGHRYDMAYTHEGLMTTFTTPVGHTFAFEYDADGRLARTTDPSGAASAFTTSSMAGEEMVVHTTPLDRVTRYITRKEGDSLVRVRVDPAGAETTMVTLPNGMQQVQHPNGMVEGLSTRDDPRFGVMAPIIDHRFLLSPDGLAWTQEFLRTVTMENSADPTSLLTQTDSITQNDRTWVVDYRASDRTRTATTPAGRSSLWRLDEQGRTVFAQADTRLAPATFEWDASGRLTRVAQGERFHAYGYDARNRIISQTDATGLTVAFAYDDADRLTEVQYPGPTVYAFGYNAMGERVSVTLPGGAVHSLDFSPIGDLAAYTPPDGDAMIRSYNADRALERITLPGGRSIITRFDDAGRSTGLLTDDTATTFAFAGGSAACCDHSETLAALQWAAEDDGRTQNIFFTHDGDLVTSAEWDGLVEGRYAYAYSDDMTLSAVSWRSGDDRLDTEIERDLDGSVQQMGPFAQTPWGPAGAVTHLTDDALEIAFSYDAYGDLQSRVHRVDGEEFYRIHLTRDLAGRIIRVDENIAGTSHTRLLEYNAMGWLRSSTDNGASPFFFGYDARGNLTAIGDLEAQCDLQDRIQRLGATDYGFDADGFLAEREMCLGSP